MVYCFGCVMFLLMTLAKRTFIVGAAVICAGAISVLCADTPDNPYQPIVLRNVFGIKPAPPPPPPPDTTAQVPQAKVVLTGITTKAELTAVGGDHLDPEGFLVFEVGGLTGRAQRLQAGHGGGKSP